MLIKLEIENFFSIKTRQVLDLRVAENAPDLPNSFKPPFPGSSERVSTVAVLFGPNASGKSTVLRALGLLKRFIASSFREDPDKRIMGVEPFADSTVREGITNVAIEFGAQLILPYPPCMYRYEVAFKHDPNGGLETSVVREVLKFSPYGRPRRLFEREYSSVKGSSDFDLTSWRFLPVRPNASVISTLSQYNHHYAIAINATLTKVLVNFYHDRIDSEDVQMDVATKYYIENPDVLKELNKAIAKIDVGIENVEAIMQDNLPLALFKHRGLARSIIDLHQSRGTRRFYTLFVYLHYVLNNGGLAVIDELDADIHPLLIPEIIDWFQSNNLNLYSAQLIATCHNASVLESLQKEQVFFTEKDTRGITAIYGLQDIRDVRRTDNFYRKYIGGQFGAIPRIG